jgi:hypothetical protein
MPKPRMYRVMHAVDDSHKSPVCGRERNCLGVRVGVDIKPDKDGNVEHIPAKPKGMSVSRCVCEMYAAIVPERLRGPLSILGAAGDYDAVLWRNGTDEFINQELDGGDLRFSTDSNPDKPGHGLVGPSRTMHIDYLQKSLAETGKDWVKDETKHPNCPVH